MKILLVAVNAKYIHSNLAVYSLRAYVKKYRNNIELAEYTINNQREDILKEIYKKNADVVAFSCYIWNIEIITQVVAELKKIQPEVKIWFGGPEVSYDAKASLSKISGLDGIIIGEGEQTFLELVEYYHGNGKELKQIDGLAFKESAGINPKTVCETDTAVNLADNITVTSDRRPLSLDDILFPYEETEAFKNKIIYYESSRGCPFSCSYCLSSIDKRVRIRNIDLVKKELQFFIDHRVTQVKFVDRTFNCKKEHAIQVWQYLKDNDNGFTNFHFEIAADLLDEEELALLSSLRPGQVQLEIGVQSTNPATVHAIHRKMDFNRISQNVMRIRSEHNIHQHLDLIAGLPLEDYHSFAKSFNDVYQLKPDQLQLGFLKVLKGSLMEEDTKAYGIVAYDTPPYEVLKTSYLSFGEVLKLKSVCEMIEIYYNSGQFVYTIQFLEHFFDKPFDLYQELGEFYEKSGQELLAHSRIKRYEILLDFYINNVLKLIQEEEKQDLIAVFKEIMVMDLYLREDLKSRPSFSPNPLKYKDLRDRCDIPDMDRKDIHIEFFHYNIAASCEAGRAIKKDDLLLFDYSNRDPLSRGAKLVPLSL